MPDQPNTCVFPNGVSTSPSCRLAAPASIDPGHEAIVLVATPTSVSQAVVGGHLSAADGRAAITYALDRALPDMAP